MKKTITVQNMIGASMLALAVACATTPQEAEEMLLARLLKGDFTRPEGGATGQSFALLGDRQKQRASEGVEYASGVIDERELQRVLDRIVDAGPRQDVRPTVVFVSADKANAYAYEDNVIEVTTGIAEAWIDNLSRLEEEGVLSENERRSVIENHMAFTLAHEYSHILMYHPARFTERQEKLDRGLQAGAMMATIAGTALALSQAETRQTASGIQLSVPPEEAEQALGVAVGLNVVSWLINNELDVLLGRPYQRHLETEADYLAADLMVETGYFDPETGVQGLDILATNNRTLETELEREAAEAGEALGQALGNGALMALYRWAGQSDPNSPAWMNRMSTGDALKYGAIMAGAEWGWKQIQQRYNRNEEHVHHNSDKRMEAVANYAEKFHAGYVPGVEGEESGSFVDFTSLISQTSDLKARKEIRKLIIEEDFLQARVKFDALTGGEPVEDMQLRQLQVALLQAEDKPAEAADVALAIIADDAAAIGTVSNMAETVLADPERAGDLVTALDDAAARFEDETLFLSPRITASVTAGNEEAADAYKLTCMETEDQDQIAACNAADPRTVEQPPEETPDSPIPNPLRNLFGAVQGKHHSTEAVAWVGNDPSDRADAESVLIRLETAASDYDSPYLFLPTRISLNEQLGNNTEAARLRDVCAETDTGWSLHACGVAVAGNRAASGSENWPSLLGQDHQQAD